MKHLFALISLVVLLLPGPILAQEALVRITPDLGGARIGEVVEYTLAYPEEAGVERVRVALETPVQMVFLANAILDAGEGSFVLQYAQAGPHKLSLTSFNEKDEQIYQDVYAFTVARDAAPADEAPGYDWGRVLAVFGMGVVGLLAGLLIARQK